MQFRQHFVADALAGITVGVLAVPQAMSYALVAGLSPRYGLYADIYPMLICTCVNCRLFVTGCQFHHSQQPCWQHPCFASSDARGLFGSHFTSVCRCALVNSQICFWAHPFTSSPDPPPSCPCWYRVTLRMHARRSLALVAQIKLLHRLEKRFRRK